MFNPLLAIMVAVLVYFVFGENLYLGRYEMHEVTLEISCPPFSWILIFCP